MKKLKFFSKEKTESTFEQHDKDKNFSEQEKETIDIVKKNLFVSPDKYSDIYAGLAANAMTWRVICIILGAMLMFSFIAFISVAKSTRAIPYVIQVDQHGYAIPIKPIEQSDIDNRVITAQIGQFISNTRIRVLNRDAQMEFAKMSYRCIGEGSKAYTKLTNYYKENVPTAAKAAIEIQIQSVVPISGNLYNAEWREMTTTRDYGSQLTKYYKGIFQIEISPPKQIENIIANPLGIFIDDFQIQEMIK